MLSAIINYAIVKYPAAIGTNPLKVLRFGKHMKKIQARTERLGGKEFSVFYQGIQKFNEKLPVPPLPWPEEPGSCNPALGVRQPGPTDADHPRHQEPQAAICPALPPVAGDPGAEAGATRGGLSFRIPGGEDGPLQHRQDRAREAHGHGAQAQQLCLSNGVGLDPPAQSYRAVGVQGRGYISAFDSHP